MKKVLIAVDDTKSSKAVLYTFYNLVKAPEVVVLLHVERLEGKSLMIDMLGDAELSTLRESLKGTEHKETLDIKAGKILDFYKSELENRGQIKIKTVLRDGRPSDEILKVAEEEGVELIILGYNAKNGLSRLITGSVAGEIEKRANVPVLLAKRPAMMCEEAYTWRDAYYAMSLFTVIVLVLFVFGMFLEKNGAFLP